MQRSPHESVIAWAWTRHDAYRKRYLAAQADPANARLTFVRLATSAEVAGFLRGAVAQVPSGGAAGE